MSIVGWIRVLDKTSCGGTVIEGCATEISHGKPYSFTGARIACKYNCVIVGSHPTATFSNGRTHVLDGHLTSRGCVLRSTLNGIDGLELSDFNDKKTYVDAVAALEEQYAKGEARGPGPVEWEGHFLNGDPGVKNDRIPDSDENVREWLRRALENYDKQFQTPGQWLALRREHGFDKHDNNLAAAERFAMAAGGFWDKAPGMQPTAILGKLLVQTARLGTKRDAPVANHIIGNPGSSNPEFTENWGLRGNEYHAHGYSEIDACQAEAFHTKKRIEDPGF